MRVSILSTGHQLTPWKNYSCLGCLLIKSFHFQLSRKEVFQRTTIEIRNLLIKISLLNETGIQAGRKNAEGIQAADKSSSSTFLIPSLPHNALSCHLPFVYSF